MIKAIIFDFFGVIQADPYERWLNRHGLKREGPYAEAADIMDRGRITRPEFYERLSEISGQSLDKIQSDFSEGIALDGSLVEFIKTLSSRYKIGLLSNSRSDYLRPILAENGITDLFNTAVISSEAGFIKPDPAIFRLSLENMAVQPYEAVFVDDKIYNTEAAEALGIYSVLYRDLASLKEDLHGLGITALPPGQ
ncbi:MAG TPA: HAD family phosphatase [Candidatus Saccharimonadales bacterium]|nr:HAD family phosphatase [Candidatus Saccharimonadales bacterium]